MTKQTKKRDRPLSLLMRQFFSDEIEGKSVITKNGLNLSLRAKRGNL